MYIISKRFMRIFVCYKFKNHLTTSAYEHRHDIFILKTNSY
jgi:hypothetical protein